MITKTISIPIDKARIIENECTNYGCNLVKLFEFRKEQFRVTLSGPDECMSRLLSLIGDNTREYKKN